MSIALPRFAKVGLIAAEGDPYSAWYAEAAAQVGLVCAPGGFENLDELDILLLCGKGELTAGQIFRVSKWLSDGGRLICAGWDWGIGELLGHEVGERLPDLGRDVIQEGHAEIWPPGCDRITFFGGARIHEGEAEVLCRTGSGVPAITRKGGAWFMAADIGRTFGHMMMGRAVETNMIGPGDGTAETDDEALRAEDGHMLCFERDRRRPANSDTPIFGHPYADSLRDLWVRCILTACAGTDFCPPILWQWPNNAECVATTSIDCDETDIELVARAGQALSKFGIKAAWMVPTPGFNHDAYRALRKTDHTIGLLYAPESEDFCEDQLRIQSLTISRAAGLAAPVCLRPINGQWRGSIHPYMLAEEAGYRAVMSKGGRQPGTTGYLFGTMRPFMPRRRGGRPIRVLEIPYAMFSPGMASPDSVAPHLVEQTVQHYGCLHIVHALSAVRNEQFERSAQNLHLLMRQRGMTMISPQTLIDYENGRRSIAAQIDGPRTLRLTSEHQIRSLTILTPGKSGVQSLNGLRTEGTPVTRYGMQFTAYTVTVEPKVRAHLQFDAAALAA